MTPPPASTPPATASASGPPPVDRFLAGLVLGGGLCIDGGEPPRWPAVLAALVRGGEPVPPAAVLAEAVRALTRTVDDEPARRPPALPPGLVRRHEDEVAGRLALDGAVRRAGDAIARWTGDPADRATAFAVAALTEHVAGPTTPIARETVVQLAGLTPAARLDRAWRAWDDPAVAEAVIAEAEAWIAAVAHAPLLLTPADLAELETGLAVQPAGGRAAMRRIVGLAGEIVAGLPPARAARPRRAASVATRLRAESTYPVGGYASLSRRGTSESLLASELAYLGVPLPRPDGSPGGDRGSPPPDGPSGRELDLFDLRWARDELTYYSRDEGVHVRPETVVAVWLDPGLADLRDRSPGLAASPLLAAVAWTLALIEAFTRDLAGEGLTVAVATTPPAADGPLAEEWGHISRLQREAIARGAVILATQDREGWLAYGAAAARRADVVAVEIAAAGPAAKPETQEAWSDPAVPIWRLTVEAGGDVRPARSGDRRPPGADPANGPEAGPTVAAWSAALRAVLDGTPP